MDATNITLPTFPASGGKTKSPIVTVWVERLPSTTGEGVTVRLEVTGREKC